MSVTRQDVPDEEGPVARRLRELEERRRHLEAELAQVQEEFLIFCREENLCGQCANTGIMRYVRGGQYGEAQPRYCDCPVGQEHPRK